MMNNDTIHPVPEGYEYITELFAPLDTLSSMVNDTASDRATAIYAAIDQIDNGVVGIIGEYYSTISEGACLVEQRHRHCVPPCMRVIMT